MAVNKKITPMDLTGRVAIISGATRGIGRVCALALAKYGCGIVIAAKTTEPTKDLPGTIHSVAKEVEDLGAPALACKVDMRDERSIVACVDATIQRFGRVDIVINNASALWWHTIQDTPINKYDLINQINARGSFILTKLCLPHMLKQKWGRVITMSPPIQTSYEVYAGMTAYNMSKFAMTMVAMGAAAEGESHNVTGNSLWPATIIESQASKNFKMSATKNWRKATILSDCVLSLVSNGSVTGRQLIDDEYLSEVHGFTKEDFVPYRFNPDFDPPRTLAAARAKPATYKRGDVRSVAADDIASKL